MSDPTEIITHLRQADAILISVHRNPDGDALGSQIALMMALERLGKTVILHNLDPVPQSYRFLPRADHIKAGKPVHGSFDAIIVMDCEPDRTGLFDGTYPGRTLINIDHHATNTREWKLTWLDSSAAATGEMTYKLIRQLGIPLDAEMALCLYTAIFTDTGTFRYSNTTPESMRISADLIELGADTWLVTENVYESYAFGRLKLLGSALADMKRSTDGSIAWVVITNDHYHATGTAAEDTENFINFVRSIKGVEIAVLFRQIAGDAYKVSFRSKGRADISTVAQKLGGGGHKNAAGCIVTGEAEGIIRRVIDEVAQALPRH